MPGLIRALVGLFMMFVIGSSIEHASDGQIYILVPLFLVAMSVAASGISRMSEK